MRYKDMRKMEKLWPGKRPWKMTRSGYILSGDRRVLQLCPGGHYELAEVRKIDGAQLRVRAWAEGPLDGRTVREVAQNMEQIVKSATQDMCSNTLNAL